MRSGQANANREQRVPGKRIMVVEDEGIVALDIQSKLGSMGYEVPAVVASATKAVEKAGELRPDLVLMDIQLEGDMDGVQAAEQIGRDYQIPVVFLTAYSDEKTLERAKVTEPFGYLLKPFEERDLYTTVEISLYRHQMELEKARLEERLGQLQKMEAIGQLTTGLAHNLNNMLQGIVGNLDLAAASAPGDLRLFLEDATYDAERAARLVEQLMLFYREGQGKKQPLDLNELVEEVADMCRNVFADQVDVTVEATDALPPVLGNREQLRQCLTNLCANARDAVMSRQDDAPPTVRLTTGTVSFASGDRAVPPGSGHGEYVRVSVVDNGVGMEKAVQDRMFEPFYSTKRTGMPTGLGLAVVYGIAREHDGWVECVSDTGRGTTMAVFIPVSGDGAADGEPQPPPPIFAISPGTSTQPHNLQGSESVLVIADVDRFRRILDLMLERSGYTVHLGRDGRDGLNLFRHERDEIDLVVLGLSLPGMSSHEALAEIHRYRADARVLVVTGHPTAGETYYGASGVLLKPFNTLQLLHAVRQVLDRDGDRDR